MTKNQHQFFSDLLTNLGHIVMGSFIISNVLTEANTIPLILGGVIASYLYFLGFVVLPKGEK